MVVGVSVLWPSGLHDLQQFKTLEIVDHVMYVPFGISAFGLRDVGVFAYHAKIPK
jgi:hypothetical protein